MKNGSHFDGATLPWELFGDQNWYALHDATGRYISDACVEGNEQQWRDAAHALRGRHNFSVKRLAIRFVDQEVQFWSPRNSVGGFARLPLELADALAHWIEAGLPAVRGEGEADSR